MGECMPNVWYTSTTVILVLYILLVIVLKTF